MKKYKGSEHTDLSAFKLWNLSFKAAPKKGVDITHSWVKEGETVKTSSAINVKNGDLKSEVTAKNDTYVLKLSGETDVEDWSVSGGVGWEHKVGNNQKASADLSL